MPPVLLLYLAAMNLLALVLMGVDKHKARHDRWRIRESTLLLSALLGGSVGAIAGMLLFRHKTRHLKFTLGLPGILLLQLALVCYLLKEGVL
ncbi:MAG: DUF1294 domain-containing protein [Oscillospiraceae bacterium]|nr:DUF1294 domain-containing protein [Oscillospiraceae bacterium]MCD8331208.1 DUF1294 domain-containing protein [Oscillospiraceae bacterium]